MATVVEITDPEDPRLADYYERAYGVNGGNDFFVLFLTPELLSLIERSSAASPQEAPYTPSLEYPRFGQPG